MLWRGQGPQAPSSSGASVVLPRRKAKGSGPASESKTRFSTPSVTCERGSTTAKRGLEELQGLSAFWKSTQETAKKSISSKPQRKQRGSDGC